MKITGPGENYIIWKFNVSCTITLISNMSERAGERIKEHVKKFKT
jgi:hypothetical protein